MKILLFLFTFSLLPLFSSPSFLSTVSSIYYRSLINIITGEDNLDLLGSVMSNTGDIDNDGFPDIVITASALLGQQSVFVIYGGSDSNRFNINLDIPGIWPDTTGFIIRGHGPYDNFGQSLGVLNINGDNYDDIIIGAPGANTNTGMVYVVYGGPRSISTDIDLSFANQALDVLNRGFTIAGGTQGDNFGSAVGNAGDINNDGYDDIIIGASGFSGSQGAVYVIYGRDRTTLPSYDFSSATLDPRMTGFIVKGNAGGDLFGSSLSSSGDINKDGFDDIIIGAKGKNAVYVIYGKNKIDFSDINLSTETLDHTTNGFAILGQAQGDAFGSCLSSDADIDNDGFDDIIIGAPGANTNTGMVYVIYGGPTSSFSNILDLSVKPLDPLTTGVVITGNAGGDKFGSSVRSIKGSTTWVAGAPSSQTNLGIVYAFYGQAKSNAKDIDLGSGDLDPEKTGFAVTGMYGIAQFGFSVGLGDVNLDGNMEVLVGSPYYMSQTGAVFVLFPPKMCAYNCSSSCELPLTCQTCLSGFGVDNDACKLCTGATYSNGGVSCDDCTSNCLQCTDGSSCVTCESGYAKISSGCGICSTGTYLDYSLQISCIQGCADCVNATGCQTCSPGYFKDWISFGCRSCSSVLSDCIECNDDSTCTTCDSSYFLWEASCVESCLSGMYPDENRACQSCSNGCIQCTDGSTCTECGSAYGLYMSQCVTHCPDTTFRASDGNCESCIKGCNQCADSLTCILCESGYALIASECIFCPVGTYATEETCEICPKGCSQCTSQSTCQACNKGYSLSDSTHLCVVSDSKREQAASDTFDGTAIAGAALASGSSLPINFGLVAKILRNTKYLDITVSPELEETFYSWKVASGFLAAPKSWGLKVSSKPLPAVFGRYELAPVFLINYWKPLVMTLIGFALFAIFKLIEVTMVKKKDSFLRTIHLQASNFALTQIYSNLDDVILYLILDARSTKLNVGFNDLSVILAVIMLGIGGFILVAHLFLLSQYQGLKQEKSQAERFLYKYENFKLIFKDFKDGNLFTQSFLWVHIVRAMISSFLFAALFEYPLAQVILLMFLNIGIVAFLLFKKPFKDALGTFSQLFCEIVLLIANICMLIMAILDQNDSYPTATMQHLGRAVIILNDILLLGGAILMVIEVLKSLYLSYKEKKTAQIPTLQNNRLNNEKFNTADRLSQSDTQMESLKLQYNADQNHNYSTEAYGFNSAAGNNQMEVYDLSLNNTKEESSMFEDQRKFVRPAGDNLNYQQYNNGDMNFPQFNDETMMNTSNGNLLNYNSSVRTGPISRPRIRGKIKMPGGVVIAPKGMELQSSFGPIQYNSRPYPNMMNPEVRSRRRNDQT